MPDNLVRHGWVKLRFVSLLKTCHWGQCDTDLAVSLPRADRWTEWPPSPTLLFAHNHGLVCEPAQICPCKLVEGSAASGKAGRLFVPTEKACILYFSTVHIGGGLPNAWTTVSLCGRKGDGLYLSPSQSYSNIYTINVKEEFLNLHSIFYLVT